MKHFVDLGTHKFEGLKLFTKKLNIDSTWNVYCFEPDPDTFKKAVEIYKTLKVNYNNIVFENKAVSNHDGSTTFYCARNTRCVTGTKTSKVGWDSSQGSTLHEISKVHTHNNLITKDLIPVQIDLVDIEKLLSKICTEDSTAEIYIKCDIEGEEFNVLPSLLESSHISKVRYMAVEWHERFWSSDKPLHEQKIMERKKLENTLKNLPNLNYETHI